MVETTRELVFGASMSTGCSSRDTTFSVELPLPVPDGSEASAWESRWLGRILFGPPLALMIGGSMGSIELPNMAR